MGRDEKGCLPSTEKNAAVDVNARNWGPYKSTSFYDVTDIVGIPYGMP